MTRKNNKIYKTKINKKQNDKNDKKKKLSKINLIIIIILFIVLVGLIANVFIKKHNVNKKYEQVKSSVEENSSIKISGVQNVSGIDISNIEVLSKDGKTIVNALATNNQGQTLGDINVNIDIVTNSKIRILLKGYINKIAPGETTNITSTLNEEITNITNIYFSE